MAGGLNLYGYAGGDPVNFSDPFGLEPCGKAQLDAGWKDVQGKDGTAECESNRQQAPVVTIADAPSALGAAWTRMNHLAEIQGWENVVELGVPAWMGGPAAGEMTASQLIARFKRGGIRAEFPAEFLNSTYNEIEVMANAGSRAAKTAYKLLKQTRFNK